jgi:hypothetical protein
MLSSAASILIVDRGKLRCAMEKSRDHDGVGRAERRSAFGFLIAPGISNQSRRNIDALLDDVVSPLKRGNVTQ